MIALKSLQLELKKISAATLQTYLELELDQINEVKQRGQCEEEHQVCNEDALGERSERENNHTHPA